MAPRELAILITLVAYKVLLLGLGLWAQRRTKTLDDFFLGGRNLGPLVAAVSASASSSSVWTLFGVSGYAFTNGLSALWLFPGCVGGFLLNWLLVAPRLRRHSATSGALTLTEVLAGPPGSPLRRAVVALASAIVLLSLMVYVAYQFQGAGLTFHNTFGLPMVTSVLIGAGIVVVYTLLGGFWAVSLTDTVQGLVMAATAVLLPALALVEVGGPQGLTDGLGRIADPAFHDLFAGGGGGALTAAGIGTVLGLLGIGLGYPGQPHVVNRFMALPDDRAVRRAAWIAIAWAVAVYSGMLVLGLCGRVLVADLGDGESIFIVLADHLCHPVAAGVMLAAVLSAIMSTADSQLLVAASSVSHDLGAGRRPGAGGAVSLIASRLGVLALSVAATTAALFSPASIFTGVLFAWTALGAAFGPLLLVTLWRGPVAPRATLAAMATGFGLSVTAHVQGLGGVMERVVPFAAAGALALWGARRAS